MEEQQFCCMRLLAEENMIKNNALIVAEDQKGSWMFLMMTCVSEIELFPSFILCWVTEDQGELNAFVDGNSLFPPLGDGQQRTHGGESFG